MTPAPLPLTSNLTQINAKSAYDKGLTGEGAVVIVIDLGLTAEPHPALPRDNDQVVSVSVDTSDVIQYLNPTETDDVDDWHGTAVTGVIAARQIAAGIYSGGKSDGQQIQGVAPGATVQAVQGTFGSSGDAYVPEPLVAFSAEVALRFATLLPQFSPLSGAFVSVSIGFYGGIALDQYTEDGLREELQKYPTEALRDEMGPKPIDILAQTGIDEADKLVLVWAAGNTRERVGRPGDEAVTPLDYSSPLVLSGLPAKLTELQGNWLVVVAVNPLEAVALSGNLADLAIPRSLPGGLAFFSNACGIAASFCLAAPGVCVPTTAALTSSAQEYFPEDELMCSGIYGPSPEGYARRSGTSFAAPTVTGALALMYERFRGQLYGAALVARLLATADDTNYDLQDDNTRNHSKPDYSNTEVYGHGLLDLDAATEPLGTLSLPLPDGSRQALSDTAAHSVVANSPAHSLHTALLAGLGQSEVMVLDGLDSPFWLRADTLLQGLHVQPQTLHFSLNRPAAHLLGDALSSQGLFIAVGTPASTLLDTGGRTQHALAAPQAPWMQLMGPAALTGGVRLSVGGGELTTLLARSSALSANDTRHTEMLAAQYRLTTGDTDISVLSGSLHEDGNLLGLDARIVRADAMLTRTRFASVQLDRTLGHSWRLSAVWQWANSQISLPAGSLLAGASQMDSRHARLSLSQAGIFGTQDRLSLHLARDHLFAGGQIHWRLPASLEASQVRYRQLTGSIDLPEQYATEIRYLKPFGSSTLEFVLRHDRATTRAGLQLRLYF